MYFTIKFKLNFIILYDIVEFEINLINTVESRSMKPFRLQATLQTFLYIPTYKNI